MSEPKYGTFEDLMAVSQPSVDPIAHQLRDLIFDIDPNSVEVVRLGDMAATYGVGPKKMSEAYTYIRPYDAYINLGFFYGVHLPDPEGLLEGTGAKMRHVKVRSIEDAQRPAVRRLIEESLSERKTALGL